MTNLWFVNEDYPAACKSKICGQRPGRECIFTANASICSAKNARNDVHAVISDLSLVLPILCQCSEALEIIEISRACQFVYAKAFGDRMQLLCNFHFLPGRKHPIQPQILPAQVKFASSSPHTWGGCASKPVTASHIRFIPTRVGQIAIARPAPFRQRAACLEPVHFFSIPQRTHNVKPVNNKDRVKQFREKSDRRQRICGCDR